MKKILVLTLSLQLAFCISVGAVSVHVTAEVSVTHNGSAGLTGSVVHTRTVLVTNSQPIFTASVIEWFNDDGDHDCLLTSSRNDSFCCLGYGNNATSMSYHSLVACPIAATNQTFAFAVGASDSDYSGCAYGCMGAGNGDGRSPIVVSMGDQRIELTDLAGGVQFDLDRDGSAERLSWTAPLVLDGFLALDRNSNGVIDDGGELFGDVTDQPPSDERNGFRALAPFDLPGSGGNEDGFISAGDDVYSSLIIWFDLNHDGVSQDSELRSLAHLGIERIDLGYKESERRDRHGNLFRYFSPMSLANGQRPAWDVFLLRDE